MGDRALVHVVGSGVAVYVHWHGSYMPAWIAEIATEATSGGDFEGTGRLRAGDPSYSMARLIGCLHERIAGNLSLGVMSGPEKLTDDYLKEWSHGDAGVVLVDVDGSREDGRCGVRIRCTGGYLQGAYGKWTDAETVAARELKNA